MSFQKRQVQTKQKRSENGQNAKRFIAVQFEMEEQWIAKWRKWKDPQRKYENETVSYFESSHFLETGQVEDNRRDISLVTRDEYRISTNKKRKPWFLGSLNSQQ